MNQPHFLFTPPSLKYILLTCPRTWSHFLGRCLLHTAASLLNCVLSYTPSPCSCNYFPQETVILLHIMFDWDSDSCFPRYSDWRWLRHGKFLSMHILKCSCVYFAMRVGKKIVSRTFKDFSLFTAVILQQCWGRGGVGLERTRLCAAKTTAVFSMVSLWGHEVHGRVLSGGNGLMSLICHSYLQFMSLLTWHRSDSPKALISPLCTGGGVHKWGRRKMHKFSSWYISQLCLFLLLHCKLLR